MDELIGKRNWWRVLQVSVALDTPICMSILKELKDGPLCINDLSGYIKQPRHVISYHCDILLRADIIRKTMDMTLKYPDFLECFALTEVGESYVKDVK